MLEQMSLPTVVEHLGDYIQTLKQDLTLYKNFHRIYPNQPN